MTKEQKIKELIRRLKKERSARRILEAKLKNQLSRYDKLQEKFDGLPDDAAEQLRRSHSQVQKEKRQKEHLLQQFTELESETENLKLDLERLKVQLFEQQQGLSKTHLTAPPQAC